MERQMNTEALSAIPDYTKMRVSHVVISRPGPDLKWWEQARFDSPNAASDYCIFLRRTATNPGFECMFIEEGRTQKSGSVQCPHCRWGFAPSVLKQHIAEKH